MNRRDFLKGTGALAAVATVVEAQGGEILEKRLSPYRWQDLTVDDFAAAVKATDGVCVVPLGCLEKHGQHLPLGTDSIVSAEVCERASRMEPMMVFPFSPFGHITEARHMLGTVALRSETLMCLLRDLCEELARNGFKKIVLVNGHGGSYYWIRHFLRETQRSPRDYVVWAMEKAFWAPGQQAEFLRRLGRDKMPDCGHADIVETSEMMAINRALVKIDRVIVEDTKPMGRMKQYGPLGWETAMDWYADRPHHIAGDPTGATPELGEWLLDTWASNVARGVRIAKKDTVTPALFAEYYAASEHPGTR